MSGKTFAADNWHDICFILLHIVKAVISHTDFVKRAGRIIKAFNSDAASPDEARQILGLKARQEGCK